MDNGESGETLGAGADMEGRFKRQITADVIHLLALTLRWAIDASAARHVGYSCRYGYFNGLQLLLTTSNAQAEMSHYLLPKLFIPLFVISWLAIGGALAHLSGWRSLAQRYSSGALVQGETFRFASGSFEATKWCPVRYASCLFITVGPSGLSVSIFLPFRFLCPPLYIPWSQVASIEEQQKFLRNRVAVRLQGSTVQLTLYGAAGRGALTSYHASLRKRAC